MSEPIRFTDREDAVNRLAEELQDREIDPDIVLAIPRGALPLGRAVADAFDVPLDVVVAKKIGAPGNPEYAIGAVASDGTVWRNEEAFRGTGSDEEYFQQKREEEVENAQQKAERYRGERGEPDLAGKTVVVVDDGVATGSTAMACLESVSASGADRVVLAIPLGPPGTVEELSEAADEVVCLQTPTGFRAVGQYYQRFDQVTDEEAMEYLASEE